MTDRLAELRQGRALSEAPPADDIETGLRSEQDAVLAKFNREADAIDKVYGWADKSIRSVYVSLEDPNALSTVAQQLEVIEKKLDAVRKRLKRIATENKELATAQNVVPSSLRIRVSRYTKLGKDFMAVTTKLENVREAHKNAIAQGVKRDIVRANPSVDEAQVERALERGVELEQIVDVDDVALRHQIDDLRARNKDIQKLSKNIVELHQMFTDMSILVESQQELINDIEYNVKEVKADTKKAADELVEARRHQKSARKKKVIICILIFVIVIGIAAAIIIPIGSKNGWFSGSSDNNNDSSDDSSSDTPPAQRLGEGDLGDLTKTFIKSRWYV